MQLENKKSVELSIKQCLFIDTRDYAIPQNIMKF